MVLTRLGVFQLGQPIQNVIQYPIHIFVNIIIGKPDDLNTIGLQVSGPLTILLDTGISKVGRTVHLYSQLYFGAIKIQNVLINAILPVKFISFQSLVSELRPK